MKESFSFWKEKIFRTEGKSFRVQINKESFSLWTEITFRIEGNSFRYPIGK